VTIFAKTFLYTLTSLLLIALLANGLLYALMPIAYQNQKRKVFTEQVDEFVIQLENAKKKEDWTNLIMKFATQSLANIFISVGEDKFGLRMWGELPRPQGTDETGAGLNTKSDSGFLVTSTDTDKDNQIEFPSEKTAFVDMPPNDNLVERITPKTIRVEREFEFGGQRGELVASISIAPVNEATQVILSLMPISIFICFVAAVAFSLVYARIITGPIKVISDATRRMTALERNAKCLVDSNDEIGVLAANVNELYSNLHETIGSLEAELKKVGEAERAKAEFLRAASHELKTPVTAVSVVMDNMILGIGKYRDHDEWLPKCKKLVDDLSHMLCEILAASRLEDLSESCTTQSIEPLCREVLEPYIMIARAKGLVLDIDWSDAFDVSVPPRLLGKALSNIMSNAVQYSVPGGRIGVYCNQNALVIENETVPIPPDEIALIFEPFHRLDVSRSRETGGNGLGLYIVASVLQLLGLDYRFEPSNEPIGMRFTINF